MFLSFYETGTEAKKKHEFLMGIYVQNLIGIHSWLGFLVSFALLIENDFQFLLSCLFLSIKLAE